MRFGLLSLVVLVCACTPRINTDPVTGAVDLDVQPVTQQGQLWRASLTGQGTAAGVTGSSEARVLSGRSNVTLTVRGAMQGATHPWHVHEGSCGSGGPIVGDPGLYSPLRVGNEGQAQGAAQLPLALNEARAYHINVHASPTDMGTIIACGELDD